MKRLIVLVLVGVIATLPLFTVPVEAACTYTMTTNAASYITWYSARLNGGVSAMSVSSTAYGYVIDDETHGDPGASTPDASGYTYYKTVTATHNSPFSHYMSSIDILWPLAPNTTYYFRHAVYYAGECARWAYGAELSFTTDPAPSEDCHHLESLEPAVYGCVYTYDNTTVVGYGKATVYGGIDGTVSIDTYGVVYDTVSHANPDGWPDYFSDNSPDMTDYANYVDIAYAGAETTLDKPVHLEGLSENTTYYYRYFVNFTTGTSWVYGEEETFEMPDSCDLVYELSGAAVTGDIYFELDPISEDIWSAQNFDLDSTITVSDAYLLMWRNGTAENITLTFYLADPITWYPTGDALASDTVDVSGLTTDISGEWVHFTLNNSVTLDDANVYIMVVTGTTYFEYPDHQDCVVWVTTDAEGIYNYLYTYDSGSTWDWPNSDGVCFLGYCEPPATTDPDAMFSTWKEVTTSSRPLWYQYLPSFLKLAYLGFVLASAVVMMRSKPKTEPFTNNFPDVKM